MKVSVSSVELEILRKSCEGSKLRQIADDLNINRDVISKYQKAILSKTGATSFLAALNTLAKNGFVVVEEFQQDGQRKY